jgi:ABC-type antimicrobial peptide transport system permease subunit
VYGAANYLLIDDINERMSGVAWLALLIAVAIAAIVMSFTMARVIIDSRHETAIFRALGAKRHDIVGIYMTYSILIASLIVLFSCLLGVAGATVIELLYRDAVASYVAVAYGIFDGLDTFSLIGFDSVLVGSVVVIIFGVGMSAVIVPLIRNVRRNPIRDMRDSG